MAQGWAQPGPMAIEGIRLGALRARLGELDELPDDALVVMAPGYTHPGDDYSPMAEHIGTGV